MVVQLKEWLMVTLLTLFWISGLILGGNMRLKACKEAGLKEVHILKADELTKAQQREFIVKDNVGFGEWDWQVLANEWDNEKLEDWGVDMLVFSLLNLLLA